MKMAPFWGGILNFVEYFLVWRNLFVIHQVRSDGISSWNFLNVMNRFLEFGVDPEIEEF